MRFAVSILLENAIWSRPAASRGLIRNFPMTQPVAKRFPTPAIDSLPDDIRTRLNAVQEKSGFVPNVFLTLAWRPDEFRAFFAYHDALMERDSGLTKAEREMIVVATSQRQPMPLLRDRARRHPAHPGEEPADRGPDRRQLPQGRYHAAPARHARLRDEGRAPRRTRFRRPISRPAPATAFPTTTSGTSRRSRRSSRCRTAWPTSPPCARTTSST